MATLKTIALGLTLIEEKKEELRKAFEDLQVHSSYLSSFTLTWSDIDSHFSSIQSSLTRQFDLLQCQNDVVPEILQNYVPPSHPQLKLLCSNMDANGLTRYIIDRSKDRQEIASELPDAFRVSPDPAKLVLDALQGFFLPNEVDNKSNKLGSLMQTRLLLLEQLTAALPEIKADVRQRAKNLAQVWKGKINRGGVKSNEFLGFWCLLAAYGLSSDFDSSELVEFLANVVVQNRQQGFTLCCRLNCMDKVPDLVEKLMSKGKHIIAVKFLCEFELTDKCPPVPILKAHAKKFENLAQNVYDSGNHSLQHLNGATGAEITILKQIISCLEEYKLEAEYPREHLEMRIKMLEREMKDRKRSASALAPRHQQQQELGSKHLLTKPAGAAVPSVAGASSTINPFQQSHLQSAGFLPNRSVPYLSSSVELHGLVGPTPPAAQYTAPSAGLYCSAGIPMSFPGNLSPARPHVQSLDSQMQIPSGYFDRPSGLGGYDLQPHYHQTRYPNSS